MTALIRTTCTCCTPFQRGQFSRRGFVQATALGAAALTLSPYFALAAEGKKYEALVLSCIDPRTQEGVRRNMVRRGLIGKYSQVIVAGAAIGVVALAFQDWHKTFWDNLDASVQLHSIKRVIAIDHRDCGAAKIAYGADSIKTRDVETALHRKVLAEFRKQCNERQPKLIVETGLISLQGKVETFS
jgi:carbonic anhydrase